MSLILNLTKYIATNSSLVIDTDLFVGADVLEAPATSVIIREIPGSTENWSEMEMRAIQVVVKDLSYIETETLAATVYDLLNNKAGFSDADLAGEDIFFCETLGRPASMGRDERGSYLFTMSFLVRKPG